MHHGLPDCIGHDEYLALTMQGEVLIMPNTEFTVFKAAHKHVYMGSEYQAVD